MILTEQTMDGIQTISEGEAEAKKLYLSGVYMEAETKNRNGRSYKLDEMTREAEKIQTAANGGYHVLGELDHPSSRSEIELKNVSHKIVEMRMVGNQAIGKAEVLDKTPAGQLLRGLIESNVRVGVSSRGRGSLDGDGKVSNFNLVTVDAVAMPSARSAYPESIMESLDLYRRGELVEDLAEAVIHDPSAQIYFAKEIRKFIDSMKLG